MRHRKKGRVLGRSPSHRLALLRGLASNLFLTERNAELDDNEPKVKGRIITTLQKAKEVRPLVERCITLARKGLEAEDGARQHATTATRNSDEWKKWREGEDWKKWNQAMAPAVDARRRVLRMLGNNKPAMKLVFTTVAPRFIGRPGGYTRIMRLAKPRLGDAGTRAVLEFVGVRDRLSQRLQAPRVETAPAT